MSTEGGGDSAAGLLDLLRAAEIEARRICILQLTMEEFPDGIPQSVEETKNGLLHSMNAPKF